MSDETPRDPATAPVRDEQSATPAEPIRAPLPYQCPGGIACWCYDSGADQ
ncbi:hypothetical protein [Nocardia sp. NPDC005745]